MSKIAILVIKHDYNMYKFVMMIRWANFYTQDCAMLCLCRDTLKFSRPMITVGLHHNMVKCIVSKISFFETTILLTVQ